MAELKYNLHLTEPGSDLWRERLIFRDALRADGTLATEYGALKLGLAEEDGDDVVAYTAGKRTFVVGVLAAGSSRTAGKRRPIGCLPR